MLPLVAWYPNPDGITAAVTCWLQDAAWGYVGAPDFKAIAAQVAALPVGKRYVTIRVDSIPELTTPAERQGGLLNPNGAVVLGMIPTGPTAALIHSFASELLAVGVTALDGVFIDQEEAGDDLVNAICALIGTPSAVAFPPAVRALNQEMIANWWAPQTDQARGIIETYAFNIISAFLRATFAPLPPGPVVNAGYGYTGGLQAWPTPDLNGHPNVSFTLVCPVTAPNCYFVAQQMLLQMPGAPQDWAGNLVFLDAVAAQAAAGQKVWGVYALPGMFGPAVSRGKLTDNMNHAQLRGMKLISVFNPPTGGPPYSIGIFKSAVAMMKPDSVIKAPFEIKPINYQSGLVKSGPMIETTMAQWMKL